MNVNIMNDHAKSSCNQYINCKDIDKYDIPTNLGTYNCADECYNEVFLNEEEPNPKCGFSYLNPQVYNNKLTCNFKKNNNNTYDSIIDDGRLIDVPRSITMSLDRPPMNSSINLDDIYNTSLNNYGKDYTTYSDINGGQIAYYTDNYLKNAFFNPIFTNPSEVTGSIYKDPMGRMSMSYERVPLKQTNNDSLSWIDDSTNFREDLMSKQMYSRLRNNWNTRF